MSVLSAERLSSAKTTCKLLHNYAICYILYLVVVVRMCVIAIGGSARIGSDL